MKNTAIIGAQWGDEGKGKITNLLAEKFDIIARFSGGSNAGHTVILSVGGEEKTFKLHLLPSGIFYPEKICVLGNGMVLDLEALKEEIDTLKRENFSIKNLKISQNAHLVMPYHILIDQKQESLRGEKKLGTTCRGIGPAYTDKTNRTGIRVIDLLDKNIFTQKLNYHLKEKGAFIERDQKDFNEIKERFLELAELFSPLVADTSLLIFKLLKEGKSLLLEGAQGTFLDLDFGTYPYVTSTTATVGGAVQGLGIPPAYIQKVTGIAKAYTTRVGTGPFVTEQKDSTGQHLQKEGLEFGTTTGRARRCGWLDLVMLKYAVRINGINSLVITKLDVLSKLKKLKIAINYQYKGETITDFPQSMETLFNCEAEYLEFDGWEEDISKVRSFKDLSLSAQKYIKFIEDYLKTPVEIISVGPEKSQNIMPRLNLGSRFNLEDKKE